MTPRIEHFLAARRPPTPFLVIDLERIADNYRSLSRALPSAAIYYAVKANPAPEILATLHGLGSMFDAASLPEIENCLAAGAEPADIAFGNTAKKRRDIANAHALGVGLFAFDSDAELTKLAAAAPGARVYCRLLLENDGAAWPLGRKFGCQAAMAKDLLVRAAGLGLAPHGLSFHVGSQQTDLRQWDIAIAKAAMVFTELDAAGIGLRMLNLGGGFPVRYRDEVPGIGDTARAIGRCLLRHFGNRPPAIAIEPGRAIAAGAGLLRTAVVLVADKGQGDGVRWVTVDAGKFGGLAETMNEAIQYDIRTSRDGGPKGPVIIAGPTCDGADVLYQEAGYQLPLALGEGDWLDFLSAGAYTAPYAATGFNGFPPLAEYYV